MENYGIEYNTPYATQQQLGGGRTEEEKMFLNMAADAESSSAIERWWKPGIAEAGEFGRDMYQMREQQDFAREMFREANLWNSEEARMKRAIAAGINPNLAASGIAGGQASTATPTSAGGANMGMSNNSTNPIDMFANLIGGAKQGIEGINTLGAMLDFGEKNKAEINLIRENAKKAQEEGKFTRRERIQLENIGEILVDNARQEGKNLEQTFKVLQEQIDTYKKQRDVMQSDIDMKEAQTNLTNEQIKGERYDNWRKEFEKTFRDMFGVELTHGQMAMLIEACLGGKGDIIVNYLTNTIAGIIKTIKKEAKEAFKIPKLRSKKTPDQIHDVKQTKAAIGIAERIWVNNIKVRHQWKGDKEAFIEFYLKEHKNDTLYKESPNRRDYYNDLK